MSAPKFLVCVNSSAWSSRWTWRALAAGIPRVDRGSIASVAARAPYDWQSSGLVVTLRLREERLAA
jgi:hypothetical protein